MKTIPWNAYWRLMRFDKPIGILLLFWPTFWALWIAGEGHPSLKNIVIFAAGVVLMRAGGCVMNDIADRDFDPHVARTRKRPLAAGELSVRQALAVFLLILLLALLLVLQTNMLTVKLAFAGALLASAYPFFKRFTYWPQVVLGVAFGWGMVMVFAAERNYVPAIAWWLLLTNIIWSLIYDTLYAMVDREDDLKIGLKSTAIVLAGRDLQVVRVLKVLFLGLLIWIGVQLAFDWPYYLGLAAAAVLLARQQWQVRGRDTDACFKAFLNNNWVGAVIFAGIAAQYMLAV